MSQSSSSSFFLGRFLSGTSETPAACFLRSSFFHPGKPQFEEATQPGSTPTSRNSTQTGWKPILHYAVASSRWVREGAFRCTRIIARHSGEECRIGFQSVSGPKYSMSAPFLRIAYKAGLKPQTESYSPFGAKARSILRHPEHPLRGTNPWQKAGWSKRESILIIDKTITMI